MACRDIEIQELIPAFNEQSLGPADAERVEKHLALCADCREELALFRMMADDPVPDPGEAYWAALPGRVYRQVQEERRRKRFPGIDWSGLFPLVPRWAWASSAVAVVAVTAWFLFHPGLANREPSQGTDQIALDDVIPEDQLELAELTAPEFSAVTQWAENTAATIGNAYDEEQVERTDQDLSEELGNLSPREMERLIDMLKKREKDVRGKNRNNQAEKRIGWT